MKYIVFTFALAFIISCSSTKGLADGSGVENSTTSDTTRDGSSYERAIIIEDTSELTGVSAEYKWLSEHYPGHRVKGQSLNFENGKPYDIIKIVTAKRKSKSIYFDISNFFGKY